jgi:hypothetical protein
VTSPDQDRRLMTSDKIAVMLEEYRWLGSDQQLYTRLHRRDAQIFIPILTGLIALSSSENTFISQKTAYLLIPSIIFIYYMLQALNLTVVTFQAKQRAKIESRLNDFYKDDLMGWESYTAKTYLRDPKSVSVLSGFGIFALLFFIFCYFSYLALTVHGPFSICLHFAEFILMTVVSVRLSLVQKQSIERD